MPDYVKKEEKIEYGKRDTTDSLQIIVSYMIHCLNDSGSIKAGGTHHIAILLEMVVDVFGRLRSTLDYNTNTKNEYVLQKFGELLRYELSGTDWINQVKNWDTFFAVDASKNAQRDALKWMKEVIGGPLLEHFGKWNTTELKATDDIIAAIWTIVHYIVVFLDLSIGPWCMALYESGDWRSETMALSRQFNEIDQATWPSLFFSQNNGNGVDILGISQLLLDDQTFRSILVPWVANADQLIKRLCSESEWVWRRGRWIRLRTFFSIRNPGSVSGSGVVGLDKYNDADYKLDPTTTTTNMHWDWLIKTLNILISQMQSKYYTNDVFGKLKKSFVKKTLYEIGAIALPKNSTGGLLLHQNTLAEYQITTPDNLSFKYNTEQIIGSNPNITHYPLNVYCQRRKSVTEGRVLLIGPIPSEDLKLLVALNTPSLAYPFGTTYVNIPANGSRFKPTQWFGFGVEKGEDEAYKILLNSSYSKFVDEGVGKGTADGKPIAIPTWDIEDNPADEANLSNFPLNTNFNKSVFYATKTKDPYKKQEFTAIHLNEFDSDELRSAFCKAIFGMVPKTDYLKSKTEVSKVNADATVVTSALPDEIESKDLGASAEEQPVSATPQEISKEEKVVKAKKEEVKKEEKKLKNLKEQPVSAASVNPGEDYQKKMDEESAGK